MIYLIENSKIGIKILTEVRRTMHEQNENFNKDIENIRKSSQTKKSDS